MDTYAFDRTPRAPARARRRQGPSTGLLLATLVLYVLLVMAGACSRTADAISPSEPSIQLIMATQQQVADFMPSLSDVQSRVLPALGDAPSASRLNTEITAMLAAFNLRDARAVEEQIDLARATLASYPAAARVFDAAELSVVEIMLDRAAQLIGMPPSANRIGG